jgi:hypothetical protein
VCIETARVDPLDHAPNPSKQSEHGRRRDSECAISRRGWRGHDRSVGRGVGPGVPAAQVSSGKCSTADGRGLKLVKGKNIFILWIALKSFWIHPFLRKNILPHVGVC